MVFVSAQNLSGIVRTLIPYVTLQFRDNTGAASSVPLQKSRRNRRFYVWTEALSDMVLKPAQKLSSIEWK